MSRRMLSGQQHIEKHTQCVDVRPGRPTAPPVTCSGAAYSGVSAAAAVAGQSRRFSGAGFLFEKLRDAEIEELHLPVGRHEDVGRLDVPMHDQIGVGVRDRFEDVEEDTETVLDRQVVALAVEVDRLALDPFEHEVRLSRRRHARVHKMRDVGVAQARQD